MQAAEEDSNSRNSTYTKFTDILNIGVCCVSHQHD